MVRKMASQVMNDSSILSRVTIKSVYSFIAGSYLSFRKWMEIGSS